MKPPIPPPECLSDIRWRGLCDAARQGLDLLDDEDMRCLHPEHLGLLEALQPPPAGWHTARIESWRRARSKKFGRGIILTMIVGRMRSRLDVPLIVLDEDCRLPTGDPRRARSADLWVSLLDATGQGSSRFDARDAAARTVGWSVLIHFNGRRVTLFAVASAPHLAI